MGCIEFLQKTSAKYTKQLISFLHSFTPKEDFAKKTFVKLKDKLGIKSKFVYKK
jgi:hypothetical protein